MRCDRRGVVGKGELLRLSVGWEDVIHRGKTRRRGRRGQRRKKKRPENEEWDENRVTERDRMRDANRQEEVRQKGNIGRH